MKRLAFLSSAIVLATAASLSAGETRPMADRSGAIGPPVSAKQSTSVAQWYIKSLDPVVGLTDEQKKAITEVIESRNKSMQEFQSSHAAELAAASAALREAFQKNDKQAIVKAQQAYQELYAPFHQTMKESQKKLDEILTAEQREKQADHQKALKRPPQVSGSAGGGAAVGRPAAGTVRGPVGEYWIGLAVAPLSAPQRKKLELPDDQGLVVQTVAAESPAAKSGIKTQDVALTAAGRPLKSVPDLVQAIELAKEKDMVLEIIRDGKRQSITVRPAKRPAEGVVVFQVGDAAEGGQPSSVAKAHRLSDNGAPSAVGNGSTEAKVAASLPSTSKDMEKPGADAVASVGQRIKRQREISEKAWQAYQKMQSLGEDKTGAAQELLEQIQRLEGQLRQTLEPALGDSGASPSGN